MSSRLLPWIYVFGALTVLTVASVFFAVFWNRKPDGAVRNVGIASNEFSSANQGDSQSPRGKDQQDFSHLPPAERINAETKARMEQNAAWREKLRSGDYSTLPIEAYPPGVQRPAAGSTP